MAKRAPPGIQQLLTAESEANAIIATARQNKQSMLKKARDDAELEIKTYRDKKQREFEDQRKSHEIDTDSVEKQLAAKTQEEIKAIQSQAGLSANAVIDLILRAVAEVHIEEDLIV